MNFILYWWKCLMAPFRFSSLYFKWKIPEVPLLRIHIFQTIQYLGGFDPITIRGNALFCLEGAHDLISTLK